MGFFDEVKPEPSELLSPLAYRSSAFAPRSSMLPSSLPWERVLAQNSQLVVALRLVQCWRDNLTLDLSIFTSTPVSDYQKLMFYRDRTADQPVQSNEGAPRVAVLFSDGRYATNLRAPGYPRAHNRGLSTEFPVLTLATSGGGGGGGSDSGHWQFSQQLDLWPLPPPGPLTIIFEWAAEGIAEVRTGFDGNDIPPAAARCVEFFTTQGGS